MRTKEEFRQKLLVEGNDDQHVVWALCEKFEVQQTFDVVDCEGISNLFAQVPIRFKQSGLQALGVIIDADIELKKRWQEIREILVTSGFDVPENLPQQGLCIENHDHVKVGVWVMPNNEMNGMLEDFISFLIPHDDHFLPIIHSTLEDIERQKLNRYSLNHKSKAIIHSWLAWQEDPGTPMGLSITKKYLNTSEENCAQLVNWLKRLF